MTAGRAMRLNEDEREAMEQALDYYVASASDNYGSGDWDDSDEQRIWANAKRLLARVAEA